MKNLVKLINARAKELGMPADVAFAYKSFTMNIGNYSDRASFLKLRFWVLYRTSQTPKYDPESTFLTVSGQKLYCDLDGIVSDLEKVLQDSCRGEDVSWGRVGDYNLREAMYRNTSNKITRLMLSDITATEWAVDCCFYDAFITDPDCKPMLMVNVRPHGLKLLSYAVVPFHAICDPSNNETTKIESRNNVIIHNEILSMLETYSDRSPSYNSDNITNELVSIIEKYFHVPKDIQVNVMPVDLAMSLDLGCDLMLDSQYVFMVNDGNRKKIYLHEKNGLYANDAMSKITIKKDVNDANSLIAKSK